MNAVSVSIVIVNYNTLELTSNCIQSVLDRVKTSYEIILVDNNSSECRPEIFLERFPTIQLIKSDTNLGFARGNNLGITRAKGKYILLLNSDTVLINDAVSIAMNFLERAIDIAVVSARLEYANGQVQHNCQRFPSITGKLFELLRLQKIIGPKRSSRVLFGSFFDYATRACPDWVWGTFFMFKKEILLQLPDKKLSDLFFMYGEDMQWCMEFRKLGYRIAFEPAARVIHFMGKSGGNKSELMENNLNTFMQMYYNAWHRACIRFLDTLLAI